ncbi:MAG: hypothetical protein AB200_00790 [Parcubacteria bacterium C7867-005]|nr:MAG: hypothetical protein AB200_00790 [Parcubacteria bacterium C7867-005]
MLPSDQAIALPEVAITESLEPEIVESEDYEPITDTENVERFVADYFEDTPILARIAECESQYRQFNSKGDVLRGVENPLDVGVMQINEKYHLEDSKKLGFNIYHIEGNVAYAEYLYEKQGAKPWMSSSPCWAKYTHKELARK